MRASQFLFITVKEMPKEAEIISHQLMLKAGMIRKLGSGLYTWLPLGFRVLKKIEAIVRQEMNKAGALELLMPVIQPAELWQETGRWQAFGEQLLKMTDSQERAYCFGPTHEEVITDIIRQTIQSYKALPLNLYQVQIKFRDEIRPRFGVMRAREFIMKDSYSFHLTPECLNQTYQKMYQTYGNIFDKLGLKYRAVEADSGAIGGAVSHEFQVLAESGEDIIFYSNASDYAANAEQATSLAPEVKQELPKISTWVKTPGMNTIEAVSQFLNIPVHQCVKTIIVNGADQNEPYIALVLCGDDELNPIKAAKHPKVFSPLTLTNPTVVEDHLGLPIGFIGPSSNLNNVYLIVDHNARALNNFTCGANQEGIHYQNVNWSDHNYEVETYDLRAVKVGDPSPDGCGSLESCRGIEVGHIFQLGKKYAETMKAQVITAQGQLETLTMGCYGLGISRIAAAAIEQHHDDKGMVWPVAIAPFEAVIIPINAHRSETVKNSAENLYQQLLKANIDVLLEDRNERPGVLFADYDLIGIPYRIIISDKTLAEHKVEFKARIHHESQLIDTANLVDFIHQQLQSRQLLLS